MIGTNLGSDDMSKERQCLESCFDKFYPDDYAFTVSGDRCYCSRKDCDEYILEVTPRILTMISSIMGAVRL